GIRDFHVTGVQTCALPISRYAIKWGKAYYGTPDYGWCIELVAYDISVNLVFLNGSQLSQPPELGDESRYVKIKSLEELQSAQLRSEERRVGKECRCQWAAE